MYTSSIACYVTMFTSIANWWLPSTFLAVKRFSTIFLSEGWECWLTENHFRVKFPKYFHSSPYVLGKNMKEILSIKLFAFWYLYFVSPWHIYQTWKKISIHPFPWNLGILLQLTNMYINANYCSFLIAWQGVLLETLV